MVPQKENTQKKEEEMVTRSQTIYTLVLALGLNVGAGAEVNPVGELMRANHSRKG